MESIDLDKINHYIYYMFQTKYTISILNSKWEPIKRNLKLKVIPRENELIFLDEKYFNVIKVIHMLNEKQDIFIIIDDLVDDDKNIKLSDSQIVNN